MKTRFVISWCACAATGLTTLVPVASAATARRAYPLPLQGSSAGNFGLLRSDYRYGPHGHAYRPKVSVAPAWSQPGTYAVVALRHPPTRRAVVFAFTANQQNPPPSQSEVRVLFRSPVSNSIAAVGDPMALTSSFDVSTLCGGLPKGSLSASSFAVLASGGAPLGSLSPADEIAQGLDVACSRSGSDALRAALAASS